MAVQEVTVADVREFEEHYYQEMPEEVKQLAKLRDRGIAQIKYPFGHNDPMFGLDDLGNSVSGLEDLSYVDPREIYASVGMQARGEFLAGDRELAGHLATRALSITPEVPEKFRRIGFGHDQYEAIFSGRLALIVSATYNPDSRADYRCQDMAREAARVARQTCRRSEDRSRMLFANGEMTDAQRAGVRRRYAFIAAAATAGLWLPQNVTVRLAEKVCA